MVICLSPAALGASDRAFVGYYPSWMDAAESPGCTPDAGSRLACLDGPFSHLVIAFARPDFSWGGDMRAWTGTGLRFSVPPDSIRHSVDALHAREMKVLLAVGGQTYLNWKPLGLEARNGRDGPIITALARMIKSLDLDGLDVDYEVDGADPEQIAEYRLSIIALRRAVDIAGPRKLLTLAAWSTGADCTTMTDTTPCHGQTSRWNGRAGRERRLFADRTIVDKIDMINVMSYDAGTEAYDAAAAWHLYRRLMPARTIVNIGFETAPQGWGDATLVAKDSDARCNGSMIKADQFGNKIGRPYSVQSLLSRGPLASTANRRDGAALWNVLKSQNIPFCGPKPAASPDDIEAETASLFRQGDLQHHSEAIHAH